MKKWLAKVKELARNQGFKQLQIIGQRAQHSTFANHSSLINSTFNL